MIRFPKTHAAPHSIATHVLLRASFVTKRHTSWLRSKTHGGSLLQSYRLPVVLSEQDMPVDPSPLRNPVSGEPALAGRCGNSRRSRIILFLTMPTVKK